jgi:hypothetical protein
MKTILFVCVLFFSSICYGAGPTVIPQGTVRTTPNIFGGFNYYSRQGYNGRSQPNNFGNYNTYDKRGYLYSRGYHNSTGTYRFETYDVNHGNTLRRNYY